MKRNSKISHEPGSRPDYAPAILEAAGIAVPREVQGKSLIPLLKGKPPKDWRKPILHTYCEKGIHAVTCQRGVRNERYKLIEFYTKREWEFYDLTKDSLEMNSDYNNPEYEKIISDMKQELKKQMAEDQLGSSHTEVTGKISYKQKIVHVEQRK